MPGLVDELRDLLGAPAVLAEPDELKVYECDGFPIAKGLPTAVVFPTTTAQVAAVARAAARHGAAVVPRGSGTGLAGGAVAYGEGVIVCTSRMTTIESIDVANRVAVVQAGVLNLTLSAAAARACAAAGLGDAVLHFSPDPSSQRASTIGGNIATNAGGIHTLRHGVTGHHLLGVEVVLADGSVHCSGGPLHDRVGPDVAGLFCGSEGVLGIVTRAWVKLVPQPRHFRTCYAVFAATADACRTVRDITAAGLVPAAMEMMDGAMIRVVEDAFHYGFPTTAAALLLIEIDGPLCALDRQLQQVVSIAKANSATDVQFCSDPHRRAELWSARKRAFGAIGRISHGYCTQDACVPRSLLPQVMEHITALGVKYGMNITSVFHAGDGNIHPILLFDEDDPQQVQRTLRISEDILDYCIGIGGTITGEHGVGVEKLHLMTKQFTPDTIAAFRTIKHALDPAHALNDGKLVPSETLSIELLRPAGLGSAGSPGGALS